MRFQIQQVRKWSKGGRDQRLERIDEIGKAPPSFKKWTKEEEETLGWFEYEPISSEEIW